MSTQPAASCGRCCLSWRERAVAAAALCFALGALRTAPGGPPAQATVQAGAVAMVGYTVDDMERALAFYTEVLGFEKTSDLEQAGEEIERASGVFGARVRTCRLRLGEETIELSEYLVPKGRPVPPDSRSNDRWFQHVAIITPDMQRAYEHLRRHRVRHASSGPQRLPDWNRNAGGIEAFYFHDPEGHVLEILSFPPGKGDERWRRLAAAAPQKLFLGIDHTAIVVADTDASLQFYRDTLGMTVAGESENWGSEQEHLNNVFGARLRITALRCRGGGPAIELLEYLAPRTGRPYPPDAASNDVFHWQTTIVVADADAAAAAAHVAGAAWISAGAVDLSGGEAPFTAAALVRDPDGHALRLAQPEPPAGASSLSPRAGRGPG